MDWTYLGHAGWLVEAAGLRLLFDPLLADEHHGGTYDVFPSRRVHAERLRPDFLLISHAHADHFDVGSLDVLAQLNGAAIVITPSTLVAEVAARLGFQNVRLFAPSTRLELAGLALTLTPSLAPEPEWGAIVATDEGAVWNQVDSVLREADIPRVVEAAGARIDLALVHYQPLLEIDAQSPGSLAFPFDRYAQRLARVAAIGARAVVPASTGQRHRGGAAWLDSIVSPVSEARFLADLAAFAPSTRGLPSQVGATYRVRKGDVVVDPRGGADLVTLTREDEPDPRAFRGLEVPVLRDPSAVDREPAMVAKLEAWIGGPLLEALRAARAGVDVDGDLRLGLEVVYPSGPRGFTFAIGRDAASITPRLDADVDVLNVVTATGLVDVLDAERCWGDVLLCGEVRASVRAYRVAQGRFTRAVMAPIFLCYALSYEESATRATWRAVNRALARRSAPRDPALSP